MYTFIDWILFILLALCVGYLLFYAIASKFYRPRKLSEARILRRFLVLFPAYKEDRVIVSTIRNFLEQKYPKEMYDVHCQRKGFGFGTIGIVGYLQTDGECL